MGRKPYDGPLRLPREAAASACICGALQTACCAPASAAYAREYARGKAHLPSQACQAVVGGRPCRRRAYEGAAYCVVHKRLPARSAPKFWDGKRCKASVEMGAAGQWERYCSATVTDDRGPRHCRRRPVEPGRSGRCHVHGGVAAGHVRQCAKRTNGPDGLCSVHRKQFERFWAEQEAYQAERAREQARLAPLLEQRAAMEAADVIPAGFGPEVPSVRRG